ncbi:MAG TPA: hypothetical protein VN923_16205, partial [Thermoanaerobaculia bacterium]|nr:hypothetical protein [Thermoanaerobaculia bacterium]
GPQRVELAVQGDVASVQLVLDGRQVSTLAGPPWKDEVDLGATLRPHLLEARALGAGGEMLATTRQWVNLPRAAAEAALVLEGDPARPQRARLLWRHVEYATADSIAASFDGAPIALAADGAMALPSYDPTQPHLLAAELRFEDGTHYRAELSLGGAAGAVMDTELTGVPLRIEGTATPTVESFAGALRLDGAPVRAVAVDKSPGRVVMVLDQGAREPLRQIAARGGSLITPATAVRAGEEVEFLFPNLRNVAMVAGKDLPARLFTMTQPFTRESGSFAWMLTRVPVPPAQHYQRLSDALAVAGLQAASGARPRAVVLVLGPDPRDESAYGAGEVLRFLEELRVPLLVWSTGRPSSKTLSEDRRALSAASAWGKAQDVGSVSRILAAVERLRDTLDHQHTVWIEGAHLPSSVTVDSTARGVQLVGGH